MRPLDGAICFTSNAGRILTRSGAASRALSASLELVCCYLFVGPGSSLAIQFLVGHNRPIDRCILGSTIQQTVHASMTAPLSWQFVVLFSLPANHWRFTASNLVEAPVKGFPLFSFPSTIGGMRAVIAPFIGPVPSNSAQLHCSTKREREAPKIPRPIKVRQEEAKCRLLFRPQRLLHFLFVVVVLFLLG